MNKQAAGYTDPTQLARKREALKLLLGIGATGLGIGVGGRSLMGLRDLFANASTPPAMSSRIPAEIHVPVPPRQSEKDDEKDSDFLKIGSVREIALQLARESGGEKQADLGETLSKWRDSVASSMPDIPTSNVGAAWWMMPSALAAGGGATVGGWKAVSALLKKRRKSNLDNDVSDAEQEYRQALAEQYRAGLLSKHAEALDEVHDAMHKEALDLNPWHTNAVQAGAGAYLTALLGLGGLSAYGSYKWTKGHSRSDLMRKALAIRARRRQTQQPLYATPQEALPAPESDEEDEE